ncbi:chemotaxis protein [Streptomyces sp. MZ04]|uniref:baeRF3 domain-containing protein n=1 Tax=Streptomyces sp. MZ04 TaxID=2559236 RepID=UPI00107E9A2B|nr:chemotaxis protein [Streptomyces sp. MZ04]TGA87783.1 chemotaxis protein [Streptomyces sp. MZ04]
MHPSLTPETLAELRKTRPYPAVTVLLPTHRREPDNAQDPVRLRNLVAEAKERLNADPAVTKEQRAEVADQLDKAVAEVDLVHAEDGLAVFAAPGEHQVWSLARTVPSRVVLSDTFLTRNLVAARAAERPYWVLAVSADRVALWDGAAERVTEHTADGFPLTRSLEDPDAEREERIGDLPSTFRDERTRTFLRAADQAMSAVLDAHPRPLFVAGEAAALSLIDDIGTVTRKATRVSHGGLAHGPANTVAQAVAPLVADREKTELEALLHELDTAQSKRRFAAGLDEVWQNVTADRAGLLAVEDTFRQTVRDDGGHLVPAATGDLDAVEDIVDEIVERALDTGAQVRFVPEGALTERGGIACALRY